MALKGTTKIELTNVKTGDKEVIEKDNLVTNVISDLLNMNPWGLLYQYGSSYEGIFFPLCPNLFGGILLYEDALEENPAKYYAPMDNLLVGYSSNDINEGTDVKRGSMNQTESGRLEDGSGYRFVFDFATSQANGTISSVGLTSKWGGVGGYGSIEDTEKNHIFCPHSNSFEGSNPVHSEREQLLQASTVSIDYENNIGIYALVTGPNTIEVGRYHIPFNTMGLLTVFNGKVCNSYESTLIETNTFASKLTSNVFYGTLIDGDDGYIWGFQHKDNAEGNSSGKATVLWIKINKDDFSFTEGSFEVDAQLYKFGHYTAVELANSNAPAAVNYSIIKDGVLYAIKYNSDSLMYGVYAISLSNPTDVKLLTFDDGAGYAFNPSSSSSSSTSYYYYYKTAVNEINGVVQYRNGYINGGKLHRGDNNGQYAAADSCAALGSVPKPGLNHGPFKLVPLAYQYKTNYYYFDFRIFIMFTYLATINNLPTPVEKTADKTMKITYILREEVV